MVKKEDQSNASPKIYILSKTKTLVQKFKITKFVLNEIFLVLLPSDETLKPVIAD